MKQRNNRNSVRMAVMAFSIAAGMLLSGCGLTGGEAYTREELENLARIEIYEAESGTLLKTIEDGETLYRYLQSCGEHTDLVFEAEQREAMESAAESYRFAVYRYPAAKFGDKEPEKIYTTVLYQDTGIAKLVAEEGSVKVSLPEEWVTFYYEMSEEEQAFYESILPETDT